MNKSLSSTDELRTEFVDADIFLCSLIVVSPVTVCQVDRIFASFFAINCIGNAAKGTKSRIRQKLAWFETAAFKNRNCLELRILVLVLGKGALDKVYVSGALAVFAFCDVSSGTTATLDFLFLNKVKV